MLIKTANEYDKKLEEYYKVRARYLNALTDQTEDLAEATKEFSEVVNKRQNEYLPSRDITLNMKRLLDDYFFEKKTTGVYTSDDELLEKYYTSKDLGSINYVTTDDDGTVSFALKNKKDELMLIFKFSE